jgi:hypothetical protein
MASEDHRQVTAIVARLGEALSLLNPVKLITTVRSVLHELATPPPGDPDALRALAAAFRRAATATDPIAAGVYALAARPTPPSGAADAAARAAVASVGPPAPVAAVVSAALPASSVTASSATPPHEAGGAAAGLGSASSPGDLVRAAAEVVGTTPRVMRDAAVALDRLAGRVADQQRRHEELRKALRDAVRDATHIGDVPGPDPAALDDLVRAASRLVRGCIEVYTDAMAAADQAAGVFADVAGRARLGAGVAGGLDLTTAAVLAVLPVRVRGIGDGYDDGVLTTAQLGAAGQRLAALPDADRATVTGLLQDAGSDTERAYLLKAVAAGHGAADLDAFASAIRGHDEDWLHGHLSLVDRGGTGEQDRLGVRVDQCDPYTCGTTSLIVARAEADPVYALRLTGGEPAGFDQRLTAEQASVHDATNLVYPEQWGTTPHGMAKWMSKATGGRYRWQLVDDTDPRAASRTLREVITAVDSGHAVPILVGAAVPRHYVLVVGHAHDDLLIYEPTGGATVRVPVAEFLDGKLAPTAGFPHLQAVVLPCTETPNSST